MLSFEKRLWQKGYRRVAGIDEAGRGPLAGPVVAAVAVLDRKFALAEEKGLLGAITDSKRMCRNLRESTFVLLAESPNVEIGAGLADVREITALNILGATALAMKRALRALPCLPEFCLIDGKNSPSLSCASASVVGGDGKSLSIAAASVIAKVLRDDLMMKLDEKYPEYGFARHKGYASRQHMQALFEYGPIKEHRSGFRPVREAAAISRAGLRYKGREEGDEQKVSRQLPGSLEDRQVGRETGGETA